MENTLDNKSKFLAQYWGQKVLSISGREYLYINNIVDDPNLHVLSLRLKPLSSITDEDAIDVVKIHGVVNSAQYGYITEFSPIEKIKIFIKSINYWRSDIADYIRSKGYALLYLDLSVEQQIEYGWVKLTE